MLRYVEYNIYGVILLLFLLFAFFDREENAGEWKMAFLLAVAFASILMAVITFASVHHIHKHSKSIESIGVKTDSTLMKIYLISWIALNFFYISHLVLGFFLLPLAVDLSEKKEIDSTYGLRVSISFVVCFIIVQIFMSIQDILILMAYHRLGHKVSSRTKHLVT